MQGFATWLDEKYNEYLQTNQIEQNQYTLTQASTLQVVNTAEKLVIYVMANTYLLISHSFQFNLKVWIVSKTISAMIIDTILLIKNKNVIQLRHNNLYKRLAFVNHFIFVIEIKVSCSLSRYMIYMRIFSIFTFAFAY